MRCTGYYAGGVEQARCVLCVGNPFAQICEPVLPVACCVNAQEGRAVVFRGAMALRDETACDLLVRLRGATAPARMLACYPHWPAEAYPCHPSNASPKASFKAPRSASNARQ